jgi:hypothetical protein
MSIVLVGMLASFIGDSPTAVAAPRTAASVIGGCPPYSLGVKDLYLTVMCVYM